MAKDTVGLEQGLPANLDAERFVLGSILIDSSQFLAVSAVLEAEEFSLEKHRRIFLRMKDLSEAGTPIDRVTLANELIKKNQLESVDGLSYLVSLDDGLPRISNITSYIAIVKQKAALRTLIFAGQKMIDAAMTGEVAPQDVASKASETLFSLTDASKEKSGQTIEEVVESYPGGMNVFLNPSKGPRGYMTGFIRLDEMTNGFKPGEIIIIGARPSMGKTSLAMNMAAYGARRGSSVWVSSLEMSAASLATRLLCSEARLDSQKMQLGFLNQEERRRAQVALSEIYGWSLRIDDEGAITPQQLHAKLRKFKREKGLDLVVLDYLQLMGGKGDNRNVIVGENSRRLKLAAKDLQVPFIVLSQLSRGTETRTRGDAVPQLSDLRDSGSIEADADLVAFIYREELYKPDREDLKGVARLIVAKHRNGPIGNVNLAFLKQYTRFENLANDYPDEPQPTQGNLVQENA